MYGEIQHDEDPDIATRRIALKRKEALRTKTSAFDLWETCVALCKLTRKRWEEVTNIYVIVILLDP